MGRWGVGGLKTRVWRNYCLSRGGTRLNSGGIQAGGVRGGSRGVISRRSSDEAGGQLQE